MSLCSLEVEALAEEKAGAVFSDVLAVAERVLDGTVEDVDEAAIAISRRLLIEVVERREALNLADDRHRLREELGEFLEALVHFRADKRLVARIVFDVARAQPYHLVYHVVLFHRHGLTYLEVHTASAGCLRVAIARHGQSIK